MKLKQILMILTAGCTTACFSHVYARPDSAAESDTLTLAMVGDIMMGTTYPDTLLPYKDGAFLFRDAKSVLKRADLAMGNLEGPLCDGGKSTKKDTLNNYAFRTPTSFAPLLRDAGFDFLSMANNHANDFGEEGIESTEQALHSQGIKYAGVKGHFEAAVIKRKGLRIGICAFGHNPYTLRHTDQATVKRVVSALRNQADIIVVSFHGGAEGRTQSRLPYGKEEFFKENRGSLREFAHYCIDLGADVVYGHGPHVVRCVEVYKGRFIAYSLGNFCTPYGISLKGISGQAPIVEIKINEKGQFLNGRIHSLVQRRGIGPRWDKNKGAARQMKMLSDLDVPASSAMVDARGNIRIKRK